MFYDMSQMKKKTEVNFYPSSPVQTGFHFFPIFQADGYLFCARVQMPLLSPVKLD